MTKAIEGFHGEYRFLSNFYPCEITYKGKKYKTSEHAYQAAKATNDGDLEKVRTARSAGEAKRLGRQIKCRSDFEHVKLNVMKELLRLKFTMGTELAEMLLKTGDATLIEVNTWGDTTWGVVDGVGKNHLGSILMQVRDELRDDQPETEDE